MSERRGALHVAIRTPHRVVFDGLVHSMRIPTDTGQVGLRFRSESILLAVESGLILLNLVSETLFVGTAGGLLEHKGGDCVLYTPFAVVGSSDERVLEGLRDALMTPGSELATRRQLEELERRLALALREPQQRRDHGQAT